ncbi:MAG TPA: sigma-70 family RNA polymerase sigma factor [Polyangiaceae bacterium]
MSGPESKVLPASIAQDSAKGLSIDSLVADHYGFVWRVLRGFGLTPTDAEDATQQVFMIAARKLDAIDPQRARSFVYGAAVRVANNARRGLRRRREVPDDDASSRLEPEERGPAALTEVGQARTLLAHILEQLSEKHRRVLVLAEIEQLEVPEIATLEGVPVGTAASRLRVAREQFRVLLEAARDRNPFVQEP